MGRDAGAHARCLTRWRHWHRASRFQSPENLAQRIINSEGEEASQSNRSPVPAGRAAKVRPLGKGRNGKPGESETGCGDTKNLQNGRGLKVHLETTEGEGASSPSRHRGI